MEPAVITLLTDFGREDGYVAAMEGVILSQCPQANIVHAGHDIPPQDILGAAYVLGQYWRYYPDGCIHVIVVDPGVGTKRKILLVEADNQILIAPDNGVLSLVFRETQQASIRILNEDFSRPGPTSETFHGRDIFSYAAACLASGRESLDRISSACQHAPADVWPEPSVEGTGITGCIVHVDHFGTLITNIHRRTLPAHDECVSSVVTGTSDVIRVVSTYAEGKDNELIALWGSSGFLEISLKNGSAAEHLKGKRDVKVRVHCA